MAIRRIVVIGASLGGVEALQRLVATLDANLSAPVLIVLHLGPESPSMLHHILGRAGSLAVVQPEDGDALVAKRIYVAPPDRHLLVEKERVRVVRGPRENRHRPAVDPLFRSAAAVYGRQVIGVVLTGSLDDGAAGLLAIKQRGGIALVQDPQDAYCASMPQSAMDAVKPNYIVPLAEIGPLINRLILEPITREPGVTPGDLRYQLKIAEVNMEAIEGTGRPGSPSPFACPECHGVLWESVEGDSVSFRCRVGHAYSPASLAAEHSVALEGALWAALRALEESASLAERMAKRAGDRQNAKLANRFYEQAKDKKEQSRLMRQVLTDNKELILDVH